MREINNSETMEDGEVLILLITETNEIYWYIKHQHVLYEKGRKCIKDIALMWQLHKMVM
jgi:hypothetical protein